MKAKRALFTELDVKLDDEDRPQRGMMRHSDITAHQLFYDEATSRQVNELTGLLSEDNYQKIRQRLQDKGFRCGFTCLFYGSPGTGKTETVLQLARQTGRDIMQVNVSEIKSKWVGDSEKNIKALFDDYRKKVKDCKRTPILLFNEADAIINRRQEMAERGVDKMENSIQNIILQEMEALDGILIATTNLEQNMDKAFERRFLYKIKFNKPTVEARQHIWQAMIPSLSADAASQLATRYDFSGGQIENIARHHAIDSILHGDEADDLQSLITHCDQERLEKKVRRIGF
jgi:SpoVK/Ycf46/Vps4 family AAA+-type ATPase